MKKADTEAREQAITLLNEAGLRPTRQRVVLAQVLFSNGDRHVTAEQLHGEAEADGAAISLATVYNTLHQFKGAGLLREVVVDSGRAYFDTNTKEHHHFYVEKTGLLEDIAGELISMTSLPKLPENKVVDRVDIVIRLREKA
ncbi:MAG: transcriptional repressor [Rhodospirillaceae bacterium]|nr:transcriptional repressor [Rhodospirillaceae bacterium]